VRLSIDDFGTGYSSLAYLKRFPIGTLKIDRSFIKGLPGDDSDAGIVRAIIQMARALGKTVIAEGVETEAQRQFLLDIGCDQFQGWLYAPALDSVSFEKRLVGRVEAAAPASAGAARIRLVSG
jgi:EAL domain-containing protein (putative c-di-GMP-specific phosphodiesterase class I)